MKKWIIGVIALSVAAVWLLYHPVTLNWQAPVRSSSGVVYDIYRAQSGCPAQGQPANSEKIGSTSKLTYTDWSFHMGKYCYTVVATANGFSSEPSPSMEVVVRPSFRH